jgi:hypothetical protein
LRAVRPALAALLLLPAAAALGACGDPFGGLDALVRTDSLEVASATGPSAKPTAIDVANNSALVRPELPGQAGQWDLQVQQAGSTFSLVPNPGTTIYRGAGLLKTTRSFTSPGSASRHSDDYTRTPVPIATGETYFVQTRQANLTCGTVPKYGVLKVLATLPDSGFVRLLVTSNQNCDDERLEL